MTARRASRACLIGIFLILSAAARGDDTPEVGFPSNSRAAKARFDEARKRFDERKWGEAIEQLQALLNSTSGELVEVDAAYSIQARRLCQVQLAALPPEGLRLYRQRYENSARKRLEQARSERDLDELRRIAEEMFCTRAAEKAIDLLGDLAFERGRFEAAEEWWRLLSPLPDPRRDAATRGFALVYPDLTLDSARVQAKQLLARLFAGPRGDWAAELDAYRARHSKAEGELAGHKGRYVDVLQQVGKQREATLRDSQWAGEGDWPTFGGDASRGRVIRAPEDVLERLSALCREGPTWTFPLGERGGSDEAVPVSAVNARQARSLAFSPIIAGHQVMTADARCVMALDLRTGQRRKLYDAKEPNGGINPNLELPALPDLRYTLTATEENIYVRCGAQDIGTEAPAEAPRPGRPVKPRRDNETLLTCLDPRAEDEKKALRWQVPGIVPPRADLFEGAPLVAEGQIWIASTRYENQRRKTAIACYPADEPKGPPLRWRCDVCDQSSDKAGEPRYRHHLLTLAGTRVIYCSHSGAIVAVDALTGRMCWAMQYPHSAGGDGVLKDLTPVVFAAGRLYAAPVDSDCLLCLDPDSGRTLWMRENMNVVHLLGVGQGRLIFSTTGGLRAVGAVDGEDTSGWMIPHGGGELTPAGRGLLIGDVVLWPTVRHSDFSLRTRVYAVRQRDGLPAGDPTLLHRLPAGNLAFGNGCLVVADLQTLSVFVPPRLLLRQRRVEALQQLQSAPALLRLGRAEADAGLMHEAVQTLQRAETRAASLPKSRHHRLLQETRIEQQRVLLEAAQQAARRQNWQQAASAARQAAAFPLPPRYRLHALLRAAQMWKDAGQLSRARATWQTIRADDELKQIQVIDREGRPAPAGGDPQAAINPRHDPPATNRRPIPDTQWPLFRSWHARLGMDEWVLDGWRESDPELLLTGSPQGQLLCRAAATGELRWRHPLPFAPRWAGSFGDLIVATGEEGAAGFRRADGELLWHFPAPAADRTLLAALDEVRVVLDPQPPEPLTAFRLVAGRLFFLQGQRRLFALDAATGAVLWHRWAPDGGFRFPSPLGCFSSVFHAGNDTILVQMTRQLWLLDAATGRLLHQAAAGPDLWRRVPVPLDERSLCIVPDRRQIALFDSHTGQTRWTHMLTGATTLSGEPPQVLGRGNVLLFVKPTNIGYVLQRLDPATGKPLWPQSVRLAAKSVEVDHWTLDQETVYTLEDSSLMARSLADGSVLWRQPLSGANAWQVRRAGMALLVWPLPSPEDARLRFRSPLGALQWNLGPLLTPESVFTIACREPKTGQLLQRLNFRIESPARTAWGQRTITGAGGRSLVARTSSLLASAEGPMVRLNSARCVVAAGGGVWGLKAIED